jgi:hypothetical protein
MNYNFLIFHVAILPSWFPHFVAIDPEYLGGFIESRFGLKRVGGQFDKLYRSVLNRQGNS